MKVELFFDIRFIRNEARQQQNGASGNYVQRYVDDFCFRFIRKVDPSSVPLRGQIYHLAFDPTTESTYAAGQETGYIVRESGFIEHGKKIIPYFIISDDRFFSIWVADDPDRKRLKFHPQIEAWERHVQEEADRLKALFRKHSWKLI